MSVFKVFEKVSLIFVLFFFSFKLTIQKTSVSVRGKTVTKIIVNRGHFFYRSGSFKVNPIFICFGKYCMYVGVKCFQKIQKITIEKKIYIKFIPFSFNWSLGHLYHYDFQKKGVKSLTPSVPINNPKISYYRLYNGGKSQRKKESSFRFFFLKRTKVI